MKNFVLAGLALLCLSACTGTVQTENVDQEKAIILRDGSGEHPFIPEDFEIEDILDYFLDNTEEVWVEGYVVGYVSGNKIGTVKFEVGDKASNIVICGKKDGTGVLMPVQLSTSPTEAGETRAILNLADNPEVLGARIRVRGKISSYMSATGIKPATAATIF